MKIIYSVFLATFALLLSLSEFSSTLCATLESDANLGETATTVDKFVATQAGTVSASNPRASNILSIINADILVYTLDFMISSHSRLGFLIKKLDLALAVKFFQAISLLMAKKHLPIPIDQCFGAFSVEELLALIRLAPEIRYSFFKRTDQFLEFRFSDFLKALSPILKVYTSNILASIYMRVSTEKKHFDFVSESLNKMSLKYGTSWSDLAKFVEMYHKQVWVESKLSFEYLQMITRYLSPECVTELSGQLYNTYQRVNAPVSEDMQSFAIGMMLSCAAPEHSFNWIFDATRIAKPFNSKLLEGFLMSNNSELIFSVQNRKDIFKRNSEFHSLYPYLKNETFRYVNILKFGTLADVEALDIGVVIVFLENLFIKSEYSVLLRRPELRDFWINLSATTEIVPNWVNALLNPSVILCTCTCGSGHMFTYCECFTWVWKFSMNLLYRLFTLLNMYLRQLNLAGLVLGLLNSPKTEIKLVHDTVHMISLI